MRDIVSDSTPQRHDDQHRSDGLISRHPKLGIFLIAGVFYLILFGMCAVVAVLVWTQ